MLMLKGWKNYEYYKNYIGYRSYYNTIFGYLLVALRCIMGCTWVRTLLYEYCLLDGTDARELLMIGNEFLDIIIGNLLFWPIYIYICTIPYRLIKKVINSKWKFQ